MQPSAVRPDRTLIAILSVIVVIVVIAVVVVFTRGGPVDIDPATPEGVVQTYSTAVISGDRAAAMELLASDVRDNCDRADPYMVQDIRMTVVSTNINGDAAVVRVTVSHSGSGGMLGGGGYDSDQAFSLTNGGDGWRITSTPWEFMLCFNQGIDQ